MKKAAIAILIASALGLTACQEKVQEAPVVLETDQQKQAYAMGASVGQFIEQRLSEQKNNGLEVDNELVIKGFSDSLKSASIMEVEEIQAQMAALETTMKEMQKAKSAAVAEKNIAEGEAYLAENAKREGVETTESGLQYEILVQGEGDKPVATDTVKVHYLGTLLDGTEFDSSYARGEPAVFPLNRVISGWTEGVQLMNVGSKFKFHIPSELAYGARNQGLITSHSTLIFEVELLDIIEAKPAADAE